MQKQKINLNMLILVALFFGLVFTSTASANNGSATVSWSAPTQNADGSALNDLAGYRIYYQQSDSFNCNAWNLAPQTGANSRQSDNGTLLPATEKTIADPEALNYAFTDSTVLTPGQKYYFAVVAYDSSGNLSDCAAGSGADPASKTVSYPADISGSTFGVPDHVVNMLDFALLHSKFNTTDASADVNGDGTVNMIDFAILHSEFNDSF